MSSSALLHVSPITNDISVMNRLYGGLFSLLTAIQKMK